MKYESIIFRKETYKSKNRLIENVIILHTKMEYIELIIYSRGCTCISPCYRTLTQYSCFFQTSLKNKMCLEEWLKRANNKNL